MAATAGWEADGTGVRGSVDTRSYPATEFSIVRLAGAFILPMQCMGLHSFMAATMGAGTISERCTDLTDTASRRAAETGSTVAEAFMAVEEVSTAEAEVSTVAEVVLIINQTR